LAILPIEYLNHTGNGLGLSANRRMEARTHGHGRRRRELVAGSALSRVVTCLLRWAHGEAGDGAMAAAELPRRRAGMSQVAAKQH
jgi:hypothetical protein